MAAKIKLTRMGAKKQPSYRVVIQEEHSKRDGRFIENLGYYNPRTDPPTIVINQERLSYWIGVGAQPTESVGKLLKTAGITDRFFKAQARQSSNTGADNSRGGSAAADAQGTPPGEVTSASTEITQGTEMPVDVSTEEPAEGRAS